MTIKSIEKAFDLVTGALALEIEKYEEKEDPTEQQEARLELLQAALDAVESAKDDLVSSWND